MSARARSHFLEESVQADPAPELPVERGPDDRGVGIWVPQHKHRLLAEYLYATRHAWMSPNWHYRVYIDPFCGPGRVQVKDETETRDGGALVAWRESVANGMPFTHVFVGDKDEERAHACRERLSRLGAPVRAFVGEASVTVPQMVSAVPARSLSLAYLDPYNLEFLSFDLFQSLSKLKVDIAAHFSTMDLHRNLEMEFDPSRARFDGTAPDWRASPEVVNTNKASRPTKFFNYWQSLVCDLGFTFSKQTPLVPNDQGRTIYRLVFFARNELPLRIWGDVARDTQQRGFDF